MCSPRFQQSRRGHGCSRVGSSLSNLFLSALSGETPAKISFDEAEVGTRVDDLDAVKARFRGALRSLEGDPYRAGLEARFRFTGAVRFVDELPPSSETTMDTISRTLSRFSPGQASAVAGSVVGSTVAAVTVVAQASIAVTAVASLGPAVLAATCEKKESLASV